MNIISHRGNIDGPDITKENHPSYIQSSLDAGYDVEIDVWYIDNKWHLGHDVPMYENVRWDFLLKPRLWLHAKNGDAFHKLVKDTDCNVFWHTTEDWVLTSKKYIWTYQGKYSYPNSICVMPELGYSGELDKCYGICTDYPKKFSDKYK